MRNFIQIKNQLKWWSSRTFRISDVQEITFEVIKGVIGIKIVMKDFSTKTYFASSLKSKDFENLKKVLTSLNIKYRDKFE